MGDEDRRWLLLIHQLPPKPDAFRVKIWRRLQRIGAVAIKNSVYALPPTEPAIEDFVWTLRMITEGGGEGSLCEARFVDGLTDEQIVEMFNAARGADYAQLAEEIEGAEAMNELNKLSRRLAETQSIDFFGAPGRARVASLLEQAEGALSGPALMPKAAEPNGLSCRTWVTRQGIHVDRMASAWLIRRFIDPKATFKFVAAKGYTPEADELRFDMFEAEYTHERDLCTFEVLLSRCNLLDPALVLLGQIIHDIDIKDAKYQREETVGIERLVAGIAFAHAEDEVRLSRSSTVLDDLYAYFQKKGDG